MAARSHITATLPDHYAVLGVSPAAAPADIKRAYRQRSLELHPDRNTAPDANRRMAALNEAFAVLNDRRRREEYDLFRPRTVEYSAPRPSATVPPEGPRAFQPDHLPDWYEFLDLRMNASSAEVIDALRLAGNAVRLAGYLRDDEDRLLLQLKRATDTLISPRTRAVYDHALTGTPPPAGLYPEYHESWYSYFGVRPSAGLDRIADAVTALAGKMRKDSHEYRELERAWKVLRDPAKRAEYDATLADVAWGSSRRA
jgi:curved DNA-binding protein